MSLSKVTDRHLKPKESFLPTPRPGIWGVFRRSQNVTEPGSDQASARLGVSGGHRVPRTLLAAKVLKQQPVRVPGKLLHFLAQPEICTAHHASGHYIDDLEVTHGRRRAVRTGSHEERCWGARLAGFQNSLKITHQLHSRALQCNRLWSFEVGIAIRTDFCEPLWAGPPRTH